ncbi:TPM domain-containing protein [Candidatus Electrothrix sp.]|uniref:TPM domain-containing protein n=1 Tax=Candidatus Electrothrix sp. TaxID=2170559 RepID=UPI0040562512
MQLFSTPRRASASPPLSGSAMQAGGISLLALLLIILAVLPVSARTIPEFKGYVNDYANMISGPVKAKLEQTLKSFERTDSTQIAVLTIDSLEGDPLEDFSIRVAEKWGVGQKGKDNGVLLLVAKNERRVRLEVGYGLEGVLTDLLSGRIIDDVITPRFKSGQFDQGFEGGVEAVIQATRGEFKAEPSSSRRGGRREESPLFSYLLFGGFFISFLGQFSRKVGIVAGAIALPVVFLLASFPGWLMLLVLIPVGALAGLLLSIISPVFLSGSGGGSSSGGGSGFGGFSGGGGGSFGGGGASGGW